MLPMAESKFQAAYRYFTLPGCSLGFQIIAHTKLCLQALPKPHAKGTIEKYMTKQVPSTQASLRRDFELQQGQAAPAHSPASWPAADLQPLPATPKKQATSASGAKLCTAHPSQPTHQLHSNGEALPRLHAETSQTWLAHQGVGQRCQLYQLLNLWAATFSIRLLLDLTGQELTELLGGLR